MAKSKKTSLPKLTKPPKMEAFIKGKAVAEDLEPKQKSTFYFPVAFHREAKTWGVANGMSLSAMAVEGMRLLMQQKKR